MPDNSNNRPSSCPIWLWLILLAGLVLLYLVYDHATSKKSLWIQQDIKERVTQSLSQHEQLSGVEVAVDGRDVTLMGSLSSDEEIEKALKVAARTIGARVVMNDLSLLTEQDISVTGRATDKTVSTSEEQISVIASQINSAKVEPLPEEFAPLEDEPVSQQKQAEIAEQAFSQLDFSNITFEKNSAALTAPARTTLDAVVDALDANAGVSIRVDGHTDSSGNPELNLKISKQRAQSVLDYLVNAGIDASRIEADGFGDQFPIAPNDTQAGRIENRRIEIKVKNGE